MKEYQYIIRAHHGMCLAFFKGKGYSSEFTEHMKEMKDRLKEDPLVKIVSQTDQICSACPNNDRGICTSAKKVAGYDRQVLQRCHLSEGDVIPFLRFEELVYHHILLPGKREEICGDCQWNSLCKTETSCGIGKHMTIKEKLLELFESNKGVYFSGEEIAQKLSVSRAAVWKAVQNLRNEGYMIDAVTNKGYCLSVQTDILSPQGIRKYLGPEWEDLDICVLPVADSTNGIVREKAACGEKEGYIVIANEQTGGRGRYGREFFSPNGTGIYMSILLRPVCYSARQAVRMTTMAAVAMCEAIEEVSDQKAQIKWVNDIFVNGKKVCGILTEASLGLESGSLEYAVLGLGINVYPPLGGFPAQLEQIAGVIFDHTQNDMKNRLAAAFLNRFMGYYRAKDHAEYIEKYQSRSLAVGKHITVIFGEQKRNAYVYGIDEECRLLVKYDNGETESLSYGEIQICFDENGQNRKGLQ